MLTEFDNLTIREATTALLNSKIQEWISDGRITRAYNARLQVIECFRLAVQLGVLEVNPAREVTVVERNEAGPRAINKSELSTLRLAARQWDNAKRPGRKNLNPMSDFVAVFTMTGCRIGEALALRYEDVDWGHKTVSFCGTIDELTGQRKDKTKSKSGMRTIDVPLELMDLLRRRYENQPPLNPLGAVFVTKEGTWVLPCNVRTAWRKIRKIAGLEWVKPHSFRVTVGTDVGNKVSPNAAAQLLGHSSDAVTRKHYMDKSKAVRVDTSEYLRELNQAAED